MVKKGYIVRIKTYEELLNEYGAPDENGTFLCGYTYPNAKANRKVANYFTPDMQKLCGMRGYVASVNGPNKILLHDARFLDPDFKPEDGGLNWMFDFSPEMFVENE